MIIGTYGTREIGKSYPPRLGWGISDDDGVQRPVAYLVLRAATEDEWIEEQKAEGFWRPEDRVRFRLNPRADNYYEVTVD